jgi:hypothetical protein
VVFDDTDVPSRIINATFELALHLLSNEGLLDATGTVTNLQVGPIKLDEIYTPPTTPSVVKRLIKPLRVNAGASLWWRAN